MPMKGRVVCSISLDLDLYIKLREQAEKTGRSFSELCRTLLRTAYEAADGS